MEGSESHMISGYQQGESALSSSKGMERALRILRDSFMGRIPEEDRATVVSLAWQELWSKAAKYLEKDKLKLLGEAFVFAANKHKKQKRVTGEPYVIHALSVAGILADINIDIETLVAALLHDVVEDTDATFEEVKEKFGTNVALLVDGVTKLGNIDFKTMEDYQAENLRKMFLVMAKDIRVVLIKLADRLHNMRTIQVLRRDKQLRIAKETLEIYAPLAHRLGIYHMKRELEDLAFKVLEPDMYYEIRRRVRKKLPERETIIKEAIEILSKKLDEVGTKAFITGRAKHFYSIYEKMKRKSLTVEQMYDLLALRVITNSVEDCYQVLGIVHTIWKPIPGQFDDYIANPKSNMYQSLHTTVVGPSGEPLEVQIRTWDMHWIAEYGIAAHWRYKEGRIKPDDLDTKLTWIRQVLETQLETSEPSEFLENLKADVLSTEVFVFTPKGDVISLPKGATPLDFAFAIHTEIGSKCVGAMVNGRIVPLSYELKNGDIVRILTSPQGHPSRDWLSIVSTSRARSKIRAYFRAIEQTEKKERLEKGRELLQAELTKHEEYRDFDIELSSSSLNKVARDFGLSNKEELFVAIGEGNMSPSAVVAKLTEAEQSKVKGPAKVPIQDKTKETDSEIMVEGTGGVMVSLAHCCCPVPGDQVVGYVTTTRGITVHRADCPNLLRTSADRRVVVSWGQRTKAFYTTRLRLEAVDRAGLFADVTQAISAAEGSIISISAHVVDESRARMNMEIQVKDVEQLYRIIARINSIEGVLMVLRG